MTTNPLMPVMPVDTGEGETTAQKRARSRTSPEEIAAWLLIGALIIYTLMMHLVPAVVGGLALYLILDRMAQSFSKRIPGTAARPLALILVTLVGGGIIVGSIAFAISSLRQHVDRIPAMVTQMAEILRTTRLWLGSYGQQLIPEVMTDAENIKGALVIWLREHAEVLKIAGGTVSIGLVHLIMGMLVAILVFFRHVTHHDEEVRGSLARQLADKVDRFAHAFSRIATAQLKISATNTLLTAFYLFVVLQLFGKRLPFSTTIVVITFICGLIPVLGNLISNTVIVVLSLGISVGTAIASLVFLVLIHKLEYLINSRIVGGETDSQAWEILLAILIGETAFGISGVVMAPIVYAFVKRELHDRGFV